MERTGDCRMILLNEVAEKLEKILNGEDAEVILLGLTPPPGFFFKVATEGFHIDSIYDMPEGRNFLPVFISSMGGNFNPVPELMQANYVIPVAIYCPVRFKNDLFKINEFIAQVFVGRQLNYGANSGRALSNISVMQMGEIVEMDLKQFKQWEETTYKMPIEVMEPYVQVTFSLYLSTAASDFVYGNDAETTLTIGGISAEELEEWFGGDETKTTDKISFVTQSLQSNSDPAVQQLMGEDESEGLPVGTAYASSPSIYVKDTPFYRYLINKWFNGKAQTTTLTLNLKFLGQTYTKTCFIQSVNLLLQKGELVTITLTFSKKVVLE